MPAADPVLERLAQRAVALVPDGATVGLGSGRAAAAFVHALAERARDGLTVSGVPTSEAIAELARRLGLRLVGLDEGPLALTVDGADEVDPRLDLIKGYGGALVRERIVAAACRRQVILVGEDKLVPALGTRGRLPVEVVPFALPLVRARLAALGLAPVLRLGRGRPLVTDNGNLIVDLGIGPLDDPGATDCAIRAVPGVVDTGLFLGTASLVLVGGAGGIRELTPAGPR
jgi:ribose 5-phosphate isomerase A